MNLTLKWERESESEWEKKFQKNVSQKNTAFRQVSHLTHSLF